MKIVASLKILHFHDTLMCVLAGSAVRSMLIGLVSTLPQVFIELVLKLNSAHFIYFFRPSIFYFFAFFFFWAFISYKQVFFRSTIFLKLST